MADDNNTHSIFLGGLDKHLERDLSELQDEIDSLSAKASLNGVEVISQLINFSSDPKEINRLAKALHMVAQRLPQLNKMKSRMTALKLASEDPEWFEMAFTTSDTIDLAISRCLDQGQPQQEL
jgi:hypothetical protein